jgi:hypothetical protein
MKVLSLQPVASMGSELTTAVGVVLQDDQPPRMEKRGSVTRTWGICELLDFSASKKISYLSKN